MEENIYKALGRHVRKERNRAGLTLENLGEKAGITGAYVAHIEAGRKKPTLATIKKIATALAVPINDLVGEKKSYAVRDDLYLHKFASMLRDKSPKQKEAIIRIARSAADEIK